MPDKLKGEVPVVAVMGRANVGKSTLVNRITFGTGAIVHPTPGVTRDRKHGIANWRDREFEVIDTGGVGAGSEDFLKLEVERQAYFAADEADLILMVADVKTGVTDDDLVLSRKLKRIKKPFILVVNKVDNELLEPEIHTFHSLGMGDPVAVSGFHGLGISDLLDLIVENIPQKEGRISEPEISISFIGRPNVGKSSLFNRLCHEERALVHDEPHTTRDTIDTLIEIEGKIYRILDTAGFRKRKMELDDIEYYSSIRTKKAIDESDVVLLVIDGSEGPAENDQRISRTIDAKGKSCILAINKWDLVKEAGSGEEVMESLARKFRFAEHLPLLRISAATGRGMDKIIPLVENIYEEGRKRVSTAALNRFVSEVKVEHRLPVKAGRALRIYYCTQADVSPPTFIAFVNDAKLVDQNYKKFLINQLRKEFGFWGNPIRLFFKSTHKRIKDQ